MLLIIGVGISDIAETEKVNTKKALSVLVDFN